MYVLQVFTLIFQHIVIDARCIFLAIIRFFCVAFPLFFAVFNFIFNVSFVVTKFVFQKFIQLRRIIAQCRIIAIARIVFIGGLIDVSFCRFDQGTAVAAGRILCLRLLDAGSFRNNSTGRIDQCISTAHVLDSPTAISKVIQCRQGSLCIAADVLQALLQLGHALRGDLGGDALTGSLIPIVIRRAVSASICRILSPLIKRVLALGVIGIFRCCGSAPVCTGCCKFLRFFRQLVQRLDFMVFAVVRNRSAVNSCIQPFDLFFQIRAMEFQIVIQFLRKLVKRHILSHKLACESIHAILHFGNCVHRSLRIRFHLFHVIGTAVVAQILIINFRYFIRCIRQFFLFFFAEISPVLVLALRSSNQFGPCFHDRIALFVQGVNDVLIIDHALHFQTENHFIRAAARRADLIVAAHKVIRGFCDVIQLGVQFLCQFLLDRIGQAIVFRSVYYGFLTDILFIIVIIRGFKRRKYNASYLFRPREVIFGHNGRNAFQIIANLIQFLGLLLIHFPAWIMRIFLRFFIRANCQIVVESLFQQIALRFHVLLLFLDDFFIVVGFRDFFFKIQIRKPIDQICRNLDWPAVLHEFDNTIFYQSRIAAHRAIFCSCNMHTAEFHTHKVLIAAFTKLPPILGKQLAALLRDALCRQHTLEIRFALAVKFVDILAGTDQTVEFFQVLVIVGHQGIQGQIPRRRYRCHTELHTAQVAENAGKHNAGHQDDCYKHGNCAVAVRFFVFHSPTPQFVNLAILPNASLIFAVKFSIFSPNSLRSR